jgi:hypothetical protein
LPDDVGHAGDIDTLGADAEGRTGIDRLQRLGIADHDDLGPAKARGRMARL